MVSNRATVDAEEGNGTCVEVGALRLIRVEVGGVGVGDLEVGGSQLLDEVGALRMARCWQLHEAVAPQRRQAAGEAVRELGDIYLATAGQ